MADQIPMPLQLFVRLLDGKSITLTFSSPSAYGDQIKQRIFERTKIPTHLQRLICGGYQISDDSAFTQSDATVNLVLPLRGGKGGFGSLLRGAATKAGQKKTNNFDACRDMSGRRLRHVNAEKRLEEWKEGEEERRLEKLAQEFLKKQAKKVKEGVGNGATQKYVKKYREESEKCIEAVELALKESFQNGKRKGKMIVAESDKSKRLKIWKGKRAIEDSDSDDDSSDEEDEKSVVLNNGNQVVSDKATDESSGSVMAGAYDGDSSGKASCNSGSEEEENIVMHQSSDTPKGEMTGVQVISEEKKVDNSPAASVDAMNQSKNEDLSGDAGGKDVAEVATVDAMNQTKEENLSGDAAGKDVVEVACETLTAPNNVTMNNHHNDSDLKPGGVAVETESAVVVPLNFDDFSSAKDMEVLGMERLKTELQSRGLKCGGTLQERAARLFLLKSTPLDKLPKKLLAKK